MFYQTHTARKLPGNHPLAGMEWCRPLLLHAACSQCIPFVRCQGVTGALSTFSVPDDFDL